MSIIGQTLTPRRKGDEPHVVTGASGGGYVIQPTSFGPPVSVGVGELADRFKIDAVEPAAQVDEQDGWRSLSDQHLPRTRPKQATSPGPLPDDVFAVASGQDENGTKAQRVARAILASEKRVNAERGDLPMHPDVHRAVTAILDAEREAQA